MKTKHASIPCSKLISEMEKLAKAGWLVVLKRLPPGRGWIIEGSRSEYDAPCPDQTTGVGLWLCELSDMILTPRHKYRNAVDGMGKTAGEAVFKAAEAARLRQIIRKP